MRGQVMRELGSASRPHRRDRSYSASRSVRFRTEIGRTPPRNRSTSAPRSAAFRFGVVGVDVFGVAHGRVGVLWGEGWFLLRLWAFLVIMVCGGLAPMCGQGVCAHGSRTALAADSAVPHDSAVPTDAGCTRVCNTHHPRRTEAMRTLAEPPTAVQPASHDPQPREPPHPKHSPISQMS